MIRIALTHRAHLDLVTIQDYSQKQWGKKIAGRYLDEVEAALNRLRNAPGLLKSKNDMSSHLKFYPVGKHFLICDYTEDRIIVLSIMHASRDMPNRIAELEMLLMQEAKLMHKQLSK